MNKVYKLVWSKVKNCYVAVSEIAKSHTKSPQGVTGVMQGLRGGFDHYTGTLMKVGRVAAITTLCLMAGHAYDVATAVLDISLSDYNEVPEENFKLPEGVAE